MRSVRPEEIQDTIGRKRGPFEDDAVGISSFFFSFFFYASIRSRMNRNPVARDQLFREFYPGPRFAATTNCLVGSRECPTIVAARNCATPTIVFCACSAAFWKTYYTFDFVSRAKAKRSYFSPITKTSFILYLESET